MYPGGKDGAGVWQRIVNQVPPHDIWVSAFAGDCAVTRHIKPAAATILIDLDSEVLRRWETRPRPRQRLWSHDALAWLRCAFGLDILRSRSSELRAEGSNPDAESHAPRADWEPGAAAFFRGLVPPAAGDSQSCGGRSTPRVFVYADPPYVRSTRGKDRVYRFEMTDEQHAEFLAVAQRLPCPMLIHGYPSPLYSAMLESWRTFTFRAMTRGGLRTEQVWCNYPEPVRLHDYSQVGSNKRQRERIRRRCRNWSASLARATPHERGAILQAIASRLGLLEEPQDLAAAAGVAE